MARARSYVLVSTLASLFVYFFFFTNGFIFHYTPEDLGQHAQVTDRYEALARNLLKGELSLDYPVDPRLLTLEDVYNPAVRVAAGVPGESSASYYKGKYYLGYGPLPALIDVALLRVGLPALSDNTLAMLFLCLTSIMAGLLVLRCSERFFPGLPPSIPLLFHIGLAFSPVYICILQRAVTYETATTAGGLFLISGVYCFLRTEWPSAFGRLFWALLTGLCFGCALLSRIELIMGCFTFSAAALVLSAAPLRHGTVRPWTLVRERLPFFLALALLPVAAVVLTMAYNYYRFDSVFEWGTSYFLDHFDPRQGDAHPSLRSAVVNTVRTLFQPVRVMDYFPFITFIEGAGLPDWVWRGVSSAYNCDRAVGMVWFFPAMVLLPAFALIARWTRGARTGSAADRELRQVRRLLMAMIVGNIVPLLISSGSALRLYNHFFTALVVLTASYIMEVVVNLRQPRRFAALAAAGRVLFQGLTAALLLYTAGFGILGGFAYSYSDFSYFNPQLFATLRHWTAFHQTSLLHSPRDTMTLDRMETIETLELHLTVKLPVFTGDGERREPILTIGDMPLDWLFIRYYVGTADADFGLDHYGFPVVWGERFRYQADTELPLDILIDRPRKSFKIVLDGRTVFDRPVAIFPNLPQTATLGLNTKGGSNAGERFTGLLAPAR